MKVEYVSRVVGVWESIGSGVCEVNHPVAGERRLSKV